MQDPPSYCETHMFPDVAAGVSILTGTNMPLEIVELGKANTSTRERLDVSRINRGAKITIVPSKTSPPNSLGPPVNSIDTRWRRSLDPSTRFRCEDKYYRFYYSSCSSNELPRNRSKS